MTAKKTSVDFKAPHLRFEDTSEELVTKCKTQIPMRQINSKNTRKFVAVQVGGKLFKPF